MRLEVERHLHDWCKPIDDPSGSVRRGVGDQCVQFSVAVLAKAVHRQPIGQQVIEELGKEKLQDLPASQVGVEDTAVHTWWGVS